MAKRSRILFESCLGFLLITRIIGIVLLIVAGLGIVAAGFFLFDVIEEVVDSQLIAQESLSHEAASELRRSLWLQALSGWNMVIFIVGFGLIALVIWGIRKIIQGFKRDLSDAKRCRLARDDGEAS
jgi:hypothetical protein